MRRKMFFSLFLSFVLLFSSIPVTAAATATETQKLSVEKGAQVQLELDKSGEIEYTYTSKNPAVATVNENGKITAVSAGSCEIVATAYFGEVEIGSKITKVTVSSEGGAVETPAPEVTEVPEVTEAPVPEVTEVPIPPAEVEGMTTFVFAGTKVTVIEGTDKEYTIIDKAGDEVAAAGVDEDGNSYYIAAEDDVVAVEIGKKGGSYAFEGTAADSSICVKKGATKDANLYLNGLDMTSSYTAPIQIKKESTAKVYILAVEGTTNKLTDAAYNNDDNFPDNGDAENAVIKAKADSDVIIAGTGTLIVTGNGKNGIKAANKLTIQEVDLVVTAENNAVASDTEMTIHSGTFDLTSGNDGIKSCNDDAPIGSIVINGGDFTIDSVGDGIVATALVEIRGGNFDLTAYDGYDAVYDGDDDSYPSAKGIKASGSYIVADETTGEETEVDYVEENELIISGGTFKINTADDAVHSDGDLTITGGTFDIWTGDDGIHSDYWTILGEENTEGGPKVAIHSCVEGIEGASVIIYDGEYQLYCSDDILNAANSDITGWTYEIIVYGGNFYGSTYTGDGYDSNNNLKLYGGTHVIMSDTGLGDGNEALDCDGSLTLAGATVLTIGRSGMGVRYASDSTNSYVTYGGGSSMGGGMQRPGQTTQGSVSVSTGDVVKITDASGNVLMEATAYWDAANNGKAASYIMYSSPTLTNGSSTTLYVNGSQAATGTAKASTSTGWSLATAEPATAGSVNLKLSVTQAEKPEVSLTSRAESADSAIAAVDENGLVTGVKLGETVITQKILAGSVVVAEILYEVHVYIEMPFVDVYEGEWYYDAIEYIYDRGIMKGNGDKFNPDANITRAMVAQTLYNMEGRPEVTDRSACEELSDVYQDWYTDAVCWAYANGIVTGHLDSMTFKGEDNVTREQLAAMLYRYAGYKGMDVSATDDLEGLLNADKVSSWAEKEVKWAVGAGLISGIEKTNAAGEKTYDLAPQGTATRAQVATILMRLCENYQI